MVDLADRPLGALPSLGTLNARETLRAPHSLGTRWALRPHAGPGYFTPNYPCRARFRSGPSSTDSGVDAPLRPLTRMSPVALLRSTRLSSSPLMLSPLLAAAAAAAAAAVLMAAPVLALVLICFLRARSYESYRSMAWSSCFCFFGCGGGV